MEICGAVREALIAGDLSFAINVPGMGGDLLRRLAPLLDLARRLGRLALALADGPVKAVEVAYGGKEEEHTSELQSRLHLVCRLLLEKKKNENKCSRSGTTSH